VILRKCPREGKTDTRDFEKQPFGELERLVTQKLLDVSSESQKDELESETWLHSWRNSAAEVMKRCESPSSSS